MRIISFNVNGVRAITGKLKDGTKNGSSENNCLISLIKEQQPDILCLQEVKTQNENDLECYRKHYKNIYMNFSKSKKGYSGVTMMTNMDPEWTTYGFEMFDEEIIGSYEGHDFLNEGRIITSKFDNCIVVTVYTPNSQPKLARIEERVIWEQVLRMYLKELELSFSLPVILCGDLNVAPKDIDIHSKQKKDTPGASPEERLEFDILLKAGFVDSFRHLYPNEIKYSYFSNFANARGNNKGWRIDLCLTSEFIKHKINGANILTEYYGSDHCPVMIDIDI